MHPETYRSFYHCLICLQVQLGGLIYFTLLFIIALIFINFLPVVNFMFQLLFDGCVACTAAVTEKATPSRLRRPRSISRPPTKRIQGKATGASTSAEMNVTNTHLTAQQLRAVKRTNRLEQWTSSTTDTPVTDRLRQMGRRIINLGAPPTPPENACLLEDEGVAEIVTKEWS